MTDSERFLARVLLAWLDYEGGIDEDPVGGHAWRTAGRISDYLEDRGVVRGTDLTRAGVAIVQRLRAEEAAERRNAEVAGRALIGGDRG